MIRCVNSFKHRIQGITLVMTSNDLSWLHYRPGRNHGEDGAHFTCLHLPSDFPQSFPHGTIHSSHHLYKTMVNRSAMKPLNSTQGETRITDVCPPKTEGSHNWAWPQKSTDSALFFFLHQYVDFSKLRCFLILRVLDIAGVPQHVRTKKDRRGLQDAFTKKHLSAFNHL